MKILKSYKIPILRGNLIIIITDNINYLRSIIEFDGNDIYAHTILDNYKNKEGYFIILNPFNKYRKLHNGTITHECIHFTNFISKQRGIKLDHDNDEIQAYLSEWCCDKIYNILKNNNLLCTLR